MLLAGSPPGSWKATLVPAPGPCVVNGTDSHGNPIEENTGVTTGDINELGTKTAPKVDAIFPYSIAGADA
jgi:hypothetical protein